MKARLMDKEQNYKESNKQTEVSLSRFAASYGRNVLACGEGIMEREKAARELLKYLCGKFHISNVRITVTEKARPVQRNGQVHGRYAVQGEMILIYNKTAKTGKAVSIKSFYDTLLHEFMHHYDYQALGLADSLHTAGFYQRISDLKQKLSAA